MINLFRKGKVIFLVFIVIAGIVFSVVINLKFAHESTVSSTQIASELAKISELATCKNTYTDVFFIKDSKKISDFSVPFTTKALLVRYTGYIKAGVDLKDTVITVDKKSNKVDIKIKGAKILDNVIDTKNVTILDERYTIFNQVDSQQIFDELNKNKIQLEKKLIAEGFLQKANDNAKILLDAILKGMGFENVNIEFN